MAEFEIHTPETVADAVAALSRYGGEARPIAGGTALVLMLRQGLLQPAALVRLDRLGGLDRIELTDGELRVGAIVTLDELASSPLVRAHVPLLGAACGLVGNVRVRNAATLGGNLCEADYASDPPAVLTALGARVRIDGPHGSRECAVTDLVRDFYETTLAPDELVTEIIIPVPPRGTHGSYLKFVTRSTEDRPCVGVAALAHVDDAGRLARVRVAVGGVAGQPLWLENAAADAVGQHPSDELFQEIGRRYAASAEPVADARGSAAYRRRMIGVFVRRALAVALGPAPGAYRV